MIFTYLFNFRCFFHGFVCCLDGLFNVFVAVGVRHEESFKGRGSQVDVLVQHGEEPGFELRRIGAAGVVIIEHVFFGEENGKN